MFAASFIADLFISCQSKWNLLYGTERSTNLFFVSSPQKILEFTNRTEFLFTLNDFCSLQVSSLDLSWPHGEFKALIQ